MHGPMPLGVAVTADHVVIEASCIRTSAVSDRHYVRWVGSGPGGLAQGEVGSEQPSPDTFSIVAARRLPSQTDVTLAERWRSVDAVTEVSCIRTSAV